MSVQKGKLIVVEGPDFVGKTSLVSKLFLLWPVPGVVYREPGATALSEHLRPLLKANRNLPAEERWDVSTEAALFYAARCELVAKKIIPQLNRGVDVILDRYWPSTFVYQFSTMHKRMSKATQLFSLQCMNRLLGIPDIDRLILCDCPPEIILERSQSAAVKDSLDNVTIDQINERIELYRTFALLRPDKTLLLDTYKNKPEEAAQLVRQFVYPDNKKE